MAERTGLILSIGRWVLEQACSFSREWQTPRGSGNAPTLHVNLSARQFQQTDIVQQVRQILEETGLEPPLLELEITESAMIRDIHSASETARDLTDTGVGLAIDDLGSGYGSLHYLYLFRANTLKIDQSLIGSPTPGIGSWTVVEALVDLAHSLNMRAVIEGIETQAQLERVRETTCDWAQGFYFYEPMPADDLLRLLRR